VHSTWAGAGFKEVAGASYVLVIPKRLVLPAYRFGAVFGKSVHAVKNGIH
jgi:hypothetical protein